MTPSRSGLLAFTLSWALAGPTVAGGANPPPVPTPHTPDLLGIYPGMPASAARAMLQKHSDAVYVQPEHDGFGLTLSDPPDIIHVYLTQPPNDPTSVWRITRDQGFNPREDRVMSKAALLEALHRKYGPETLSRSGGGNTIVLYWIFDSQGHLLSHADPVLMRCSGAEFAPLIGNGPVGGAANIDPCLHSFYAATAWLNMLGDQMLSQYEVELVNLPYALHASLVTAGASQAAAEKARNAALHKADRNVPQF